MSVRRKPDICGKIEKVVIREGQQVNEGDVLFEIDPVPFRLAVQQAKANLDQARTSYDNLVANVKIYGQMRAAALSISLLNQFQSIRHHSATGGGSDAARSLIAATACCGCVGWGSCDLMQFQAL
jgi:multidrug resistance efflux pump